MPRLGIDVMGGDYGPKVLIPGALRFLEMHDKAQNIELVLYGVKQEIDAILSPNEQARKNIEIIPAENSIAADFHPEGREWMKTFKESSMLRMLSDLIKGEIDGAMSAGNTGAFVAGSILKVGRLTREIPVALASEFPSPKKPYSLALDMGARPDVSVENLMEYAFLAEAYEQARYDRSIPVATLNIGTEDGKGTKLQQEINKLLREIGEKRILDYIGNIEPDGMLQGSRKAIIAGAVELNMVLKAMKAASDYTLDRIPFFGSLLKRFATGNSAGALLLGVQKPLAKANGNSNERIIANTLIELLRYVEADKERNIIENMGSIYTTLRQR